MTSKLRKKIALERIRILYLLAIKNIKTNPHLSKRYIELILLLRKKHHPKVPRYIKYFICKKCLLPLIPGLNCRVRTKSNRFKHLVITCLNCGNVKRIGFDKYERKRKTNAKSEISYNKS